MKVSRLTRLIAKSIDMFIVLILSFFLYPVGIILAVVYMIFSDSLQLGQSVGKKFMGFKVISTEDGSSCSIKQSTIRNLPIIIPLVFAIIPLWGFFFALLVGVPFVLLEIYLIYSLDSGNRLGDVMSDTTVMAGSSGNKNTQKSNSKEKIFESNPL